MLKSFLRGNIVVVENMMHLLWILLLLGEAPKGEVWSIETQMAKLLTLCKNILSDSPRFILLTTHSPGISALTLKNMIIKFLVGKGSGTFQVGDMSVYDTGSGLHLPNGFYARYSANS